MTGTTHIPPAPKVPPAVRPASGEFHPSLISGGWVPGALPTIPAGNPPSFAHLFSTDPRFSLQRAEGIREQLTGDIDELIANEQSDLDDEEHGNLVRKLVAYLLGSGWVTNEPKGS
ncbi:hypothetical protein [Pseudolysinimonas sp.]|uniref:hypothetical protein n=1 Tax=Pseudolysinimonas sp. TaxID=2680009 RepID=UPI003F7FCF0F